MSIKKLGGIRLRLTVGLVAGLAILGAVLAFAPRKLNPTVECNPDCVVGGWVLAFVELTGLDDDTTYWIVPTQGGSPSYVGLVQYPTQVYPWFNGFVFRTGFTPDAIKINGTGADLSSSSGCVTLMLQTSVVCHEETLDIELRADDMGMPSGSVLSSDELYVMTMGCE